MAAYISVPRDLTKVKSKVAFNLTKRQLICFGTAALIGVPLFFLLRDSGGNSAATLGMMAVMLPAFFLGMSHCGIYLGNGMMVSAGDPIKYADIHSSYWQQYLAGFGRLSK